MSDWVERYVRVLQVSDDAAGPPTLARLRQLCRAHVLRVPFENISAVVRRAAAPTRDGPVAGIDVDAILDSWQARGGGGVCVDASPMFRRLLDTLGYEVRPTLARISFPGSHQASIVTLDGREYLVDVANGAPFFEPIPVDEETTFHVAGLGWRFRRESQDMLVQDRYIDAQWTPFCYYTLPAASDADVEAAYQRHHRPGESWVVGSLTLVRCTETEVVRLRDTELIRFTPDGSTVETIALADLPGLVDDVFGLPALPIREASVALGLQARDAIAADDRTAPSGRPTGVSGRDGAR